MDIVSVPLSGSAKSFVDEQVAAGNYDDAGDYLHDLVRAEARRKAQEELEALLLEGLEGEATPWTREDAQRLRDRAKRVS